MYDECTEAEYLAEISDYGFNDFEPYDDYEKSLYLDAKGRCFSRKDVGKYVVIQNSRSNQKVMPTMFLVDRNRTKRMWWSPDSSYAMVFNSKDAAERQANKYRYNKPRVKRITSAMAETEEFLLNYGHNY